MQTTRWLAARWIRADVRRLTVQITQAGIVGALAIALLSGAERSSHVAERYLASIPRYDATVQSPTIDAERVRNLPGVMSVAPTSFVAFARIPGPGQDPMVISGKLFDFSALRDPTIQVLEGRLPDGTDPFEIMLNRSAANAVGVHSGEHVTLQSFGRDQLPEIERGVFRPAGPRYRFLVTAVVRFPDEVATAEVSGPLTNTEVSHALLGLDQRFQTEHRAESLDFGTGYLVRLRGGGADFEAFSQAVRASVASSDELYVSPAPRGYPRAQSVRAPVAIETTALFALGLAVLVVALAVDVVLLRSIFRLKREDCEVLRGLGATTGMLRSARLIEASPVVAMTIAMSAALAYVISDRFPIGTGRLIDLEPGRQMSWPVVTAVGAVLAAATLGAALPGERRRARRPPEQPMTLYERLSRGGRGLATSLGAQLAFRDRLGRSSSTARQSTVGVAALAVMALGLAGWNQGLQHVYLNQAAHGWPWDAAIGNIHFPLQPTTVASLRRDPRIAALTLFSAGQASVDDEIIDVYAYDSSGTAPPTMLRGRLPTGDDEIALGRTFALSHGLSIGSTATLSLAGLDYDPTGRIRTNATMRVVGYAVLPALGEGDTGVSALVSADAIAAQDGNADLRLALLRYTRHLPRAELDGSVGRDYSEERFTDVTPPRVSNLWNVRALPWLGVILAALIAALLTGAAASRATSHHSKELAVLHALGLRPRHRRRLLRWTAGWPVVVALSAASPMGLLLGHRWWEHETLRLAMRPTVIVAWPVALGLAIVLFVAIIVAAAFVARRSDHDEALRVE